MIKLNDVEKDKEICDAIDFINEPLLFQSVVHRSNRLNITQELTLILTVERVYLWRKKKVWRS